MKKKDSPRPVDTSRKKLTPDLIWRQRYLMLMSLPFFIWLIIFKYIPLWGWTMAFQKVEASTFAIPVWQREFVGFGNFQKAFGLRDFKPALINTLGISFLDIFAGTSLTFLLTPLFGHIRSLPS